MADSLKLSKGDIDALAKAIEKAFSKSQCCKGFKGAKSKPEDTSEPDDTSDEGSSESSYQYDKDYLDTLDSINEKERIRLGITKEQLEKLKEVRDSYKKLKFVATDINATEKEKLNLSEEQLEHLQDSLYAYRETRDYIQMIKKDQSRYNEYLEELKEKQKEYNQLLDETEKQVERHKKARLKLDIKEKQLKNALQNNNLEEAALLVQEIEDLKVIVSLEEEKLSVLQKETKELGVQVKALRDALIATRSWKGLMKNIGGAYSSIWTFAKGIVNSFESWNVFAYQKAIRQTAGSMGLFGSAAEDAKKSMMAISHTSVDFGMDMEKIAEMQASFSENLGRAVILSKDAGIRMAALAKVTGLGTEGMSEFVSNMDRFGYSAQRSGEFMEQVVNDASKMGLNSAKVVKNITQNIKLLNRFNFKNGAAGLAKMAKMATKLGVSMDMASATVDKLFDIEGAVQMSAELQVMGGEWAKLADPFKLMYMARNDMEGLTESIVNATKNTATFNEKTGEFVISGLEMHRLKKVAESLGMDYQELVSSAKNLAKFDKIKMNIKGNVDDDLKEFISSQAEYSQSDKQFVMYINGDKKLLSQLTDQDRDILKQRMASKADAVARAKDMNAINEDFNNILTKFKQMLVPILEGLSKTLRPVLDNLLKALNNEEFRKKVAKLAESIGKFVGTFVGGLGQKIIKALTNPEFIKKIEEFGKYVYSFVSGIGKWMLENPLTTLLLPAMFEAAKWFISGQILRAGFNSLGPMGGPMGPGGPTAGMFGQTAGGGMAGFGKNIMKGLGSKALIGGGIFSGLLGGYMQYQQNAASGMKGEENLGRSALYGLGAGGGAYLGAAIGTALFPVVGTAIGGLIGGALGAWGGGSLGSSIGDKIYGTPQGSAPTNPTQRVDDGITQGKIIEFNPRDKFMMVDDNTMVAGTNENGNKELAETLKNNYSTMEMFGKGNRLLENKFIKSLSKQKDKKQDIKKDKSINKLKVNDGIVKLKKDKKEKSLGIDSLFDEYNKGLEIPSLGNQLGGLFDNFSNQISKVKNEDGALNTYDDLSVKNLSKSIKSLIGGIDSYINKNKTAKDNNKKDIDYKKLLGDKKEDNPFISGIKDGLNFNNILKEDRKVEKVDDAIIKTTDIEKNIKVGLDKENFDANISKLQKFVDGPKNLKFNLDEFNNSEIQSVIEKEGQKYLKLFEQNKDFKKPNKINKSNVLNDIEKSFKGGLSDTVNSLKFFNEQINNKQNKLSDFNRNQKDISNSLNSALIDKIQPKKEEKLLSTEKNKEKINFEEQNKKLVGVLNKKLLDRFSVPKIQDIDLTGFEKTKDLSKDQNFDKLKSILERNLFEKLDKFEYGKSVIDSISQKDLKNIYGELIRDKNIKDNKKLSKLIQEKLFNFNDKLKFDTVEQKENIKEKPEIQKVKEKLAKKDKEKDINDKLFGELNKLSNISFPDTVKYIDNLSRGNKNMPISDIKNTFDNMFSLIKNVGKFDDKTGQYNYTGIELERLKRISQTLGIDFQKFVNMGPDRDKKFGEQINIFDKITTENPKMKVSDVMDILKDLSSNVRPTEFEIPNPIEAKVKEPKQKQQINTPIADALKGISNLNKLNVKENIPTENELSSFYYNKLLNQNKVSGLKNQTIDEQNKTFEEDKNTLLQAQNNISELNRFLLRDSLVKFNEKDKFVKVNDGAVIAGTNENGNKELAKVLAGSAPTFSNTDRLSKMPSQQHIYVESNIPDKINMDFENINFGGRIEVSAGNNMTDEVGKSLLNSSVFLRDISRLIHQETNKAISGKN